MKRYSYVIAGASVAGLSALRAIRSRDSNGPILLIHNESCLPYKRTQLSKRLARGFLGDELAIYPREWYLANKVEFLRGVQAVSIDLRLRQLPLNNGEIVGYQSLLLSTGASPTALDVKGSEHIHYVRQMDQAEIVSRRMKDIQSAISIGFGVQGIELADQCVSAGLRTMLVGRNQTLMHKYLDDEASRRLEHRAAVSGVKVVRAGVSEVRQKENGYLVLAGGVELEAGLVVASVGANAANVLAITAGLPISPRKPYGVVVERDMRTIEEGVYAAGDVAAPLAGASWGLWHAAEAAGATAGTNMAGGDLRPEPKTHRLKCEAFGGYLFSLNYWNAHSDESATVRTICNSQALYVRVWERAGRSIAVVLDAYPNPGQAWAKEMGKRLQQLVGTGARANDIREALEA